MFEAREREFAQLADDRNFATPTAFRATLMWKVSRAYHHLLDRSRVPGDRFAATHRIMLRRFGLGVTDMSVRPRFQISSSRLLDRGELSPSTTRGSVGAEWGVEDSVERERFRRFIHDVPLDRQCDSECTAEFIQGGTAELTR